MQLRENKKREVSGGEKRCVLTVYKKSKAIFKLGHLKNEREIKKKQKETLLYVEINLRKGNTIRS